MNARVKVQSTPTLGADVEAFVWDAYEEDYVPCVGILPGTKEKPHPLPGMKKGFAVQEDNVMAEFNIPPCTNISQFVSAISSARAGVAKMLAERNKNYRLQFYPSVMFDSKQLRSKQAKEIGCSPDFDAYEAGAARTKFPTLGLSRGAGGHIHLGGDFQCPDWVAALFADLFLGIGAHVGVDTSQRKKWYGQPGIFRPKPYGIEYRTPTCEWAYVKSRTRAVGTYGLYLATYLTESDAREIQRAFRGIDWLRVKNYLANGKLPHGRDDERNLLIGMANKVGLNI